MKRIGFGVGAAAAAALLLSGCGENVADTAAGKMATETCVERLQDYLRADVWSDPDATLNADGVKVTRFKDTPQFYEVELANTIQMSCAVEVDDAGNYLGRFAMSVGGQSIPDNWRDLG